MDSDPLWVGVDRLLDKAESDAGLTFHGLHLLAARRWRGRGTPVPDRLALAELVALQHEAHARQALRDARDACDERLILLKGMEVAAHYPDAGLRPFADIDLLSAEPERTQAALIASGFDRVGELDDAYFDGLHHLRPLASPAGHVVIEVHRRPNWVSWQDPPRRSELIECSVPSATGIDGIETLQRELHAVAVAAHSWGERPLRRMGDLVDVAALADGADAALISETAERWGLSRLWQTTYRVASAVIIGSPDPLPIRLWARDLRNLRERIVFEDHLRSWLSPYSVLPFGRATRALGRQVVNDLTPSPGESWSNKLVRTREAVLHPGRSTTEHARVIGAEGIRPRHRRRPDE
jgi:hypothetical protein